MSSYKLFVGVKNSRRGSVTMHDIAVFNEYGTELAPPRPAFRMGTDRAVNASRALIQRALRNIAIAVDKKRKKDADKILRNVLTRIGASAKKNVKQIIKAGETAPNAPATVKKKGFDHPLWETGALHDAVDFEVKRG